MKRHRKVLIVLLLMLPLCSWGLDSDRNQPATLKADTAEINNKTGINHYRGHVQLDQGTTHIRADYGTTQVNQQRQLQKAIAISKSKQLAYYRTQPKPNDEILHAKAKKIIWYPQQNKILLLGKASIKQGRNTYRAPKIEYDVKNERVISTPSKHGRTEIIIYPEKKSS